MAGHWFFFVLIYSLGNLLLQCSVNVVNNFPQVTLLVIADEISLLLFLVMKLLLLLLLLNCLMCRSTDLVLGSDKWTGDLLTVPSPMWEVSTAWCSNIDCLIQFQLLTMLLHNSHYCCCCHHCNFPQFRAIYSVIICMRVYACVIHLLFSVNFCFYINYYLHCDACS